MTCIIGLEVFNKVYMISDSCVSNDNNYQKLRFPQKIFKIGPAVIGCTTSVRFLEIIKNGTFDGFRQSLERMSISPHLYVAGNVLIDVFVPELIRNLENAGYLEINNNVSKGGTLLVGIAGELYVIYNDFCVMRSGCEYAAIGSGADIASGAMGVLTKRIAEDKWDECVDAMLNDAMSVVCEHNQYVMPPFYIKSSG